MSFLVASVSRGEYWATCLRVLRHNGQSCSYCVKLYIISGLDILFGNAIERGVVVEAKVAGVDDVIGSRLASQFV